MITNILNQSFADFAKNVEEKGERQRLDILADYYTSRVSTNETQLITKYAESLISGGQPHTPDPRLYMRRDLLGLVQDSYALGIADALVDLEDVQFANKKTDAEFALSPDDKLQRDITRLQRDIQASQNIVRQTKTLDGYTKSLKTLQKQAQALQNTQAIETLTGLSQDLQALKTANTVRGTSKLINQQLQKGQNQQQRIQDLVDNQIIAEGQPNTQDYLVKRAIEEKLKYLQNRRDSLAQTPPVVIDEDSEFFKWYAQKRLVPIANRYQQGLQDKNTEAKKIVTEYTEKINNGTITQAAKGDYTDRIVRKILNIEEKATAKGRPIKRVQRVVATELAIAYNVGRLKAYMKAGIQYVTISTSMYSATPCKYCVDTEQKTRDNPISIASLLKNAYKNRGFDKNLNRPVEQRYLVSHPYCFVDGTMVTMYDILKGKEYQKNISEIIVGDYVKVPTKNKYQKVVQTHKHHYGEYLYKIRTNTGQTIITTGNHPLWDGTNWREAQYLSVGDSLFTSSPESKRIDGTSVRTQQDYKECNRFVSSNENQQQVGNDNSESTWDSQNSQTNANREEQNRYKSKTIELKSNDSQQSLERYRGEKENVSCNGQEDQTTRTLQQNEQTSKWKKYPLQEWVQPKTRTLCEKWLGIQRRINSSKVRLKVRVRESIIISRWQNLFTRLLSSRLGCVCRSERLLDRGGQGQVQPLYRTVSRYQTSVIRQRQLSETDQSFQGLSRVYIESIEKFVEPQFVYNISVLDDNMYFANNILSHNCMCIYLPHPKRDPEEKAESTGIYADPNSWKFILGAGLGVSLVFLAFALTTGRKIEIPQTIPAIIPSKVIPTLVTDTPPITIPVQALSQSTQVPLPILLPFIRNLSEDKQKNYADIITNPDIPFVLKQAMIYQEAAQDGIPIFDKDWQQLETIAVATTTTKGVIRTFINNQIKKIVTTYNRNELPANTRLNQEQQRIQDINLQTITKQNISAINNSLKSVDNTFFKSQLKSIQLTKQIAEESLAKVIDKTNQADIRYTQELQQTLETLSSMETVLLEKRTIVQDLQEQLSTIKPITKQVRQAKIKQQITNTQAMVDKLIVSEDVFTTIASKSKQELWLSRSQEEYEKLLALLAELPITEASKYQKILTDLNRRIKKAQGIDLKRFTGDIINFKTSYKYF